MFLIIISAFASGNVALQMNNNSFAYSSKEEDFMLRII